MSKVSWSEFIIVWLAVCVVIDIVLTYLNKQSGNHKDSDSEERKARIKQLYTPYRDDVSYEASLRRASMMKVAVLAPFEETMPVETRGDETCAKAESEEQVELTELQQETSDIVKMLFG